MYFLILEYQHITACVGTIKHHSQSKRILQPVSMVIRGSRRQQRAASRASGQGLRPWGYPGWSFPGSVDTLARRRSRIVTAEIESGPWATNNLVKNTLVQHALGAATLPELVVLRLETVPVVAELVQAVLVDIFEPAGTSVISAVLVPSPPSSPHGRDCRGGDAIPSATIRPDMMRAYTLVAHLVTFLPSLRHSNSPRPLASSLHIM